MHAGIDRTYIHVPAIRRRYISVCGGKAQHWSETIDVSVSLLTRARKRLWLSRLGGTAGEPSSSSERNKLGEGVFLSYTQ